jgi:phosphoglycerate dehydrogenase-like enzyme
MLGNESEIILGDAPLVRDHLRLYSSSVPPSSKLQWRWVQGTFAGVEKFHFLDSDISSLYRKMTVSRVGSGFNQQMIEYVFGNLLNVKLQVELLKAAQRERVWDQERVKGEKEDLGNKTIAILGSGEIGTAIASASKAFSMNALGYATRTKSTEGTPFVRISNCLEEIISEADVIVSVLPSTPATTNLLLLDTFRKCKRRPIFINIGRGNVTRSEDVIGALNEDVLTHAILDVFSTEPLPTDDPLWGHKQVTITPHISAVSTPQIVSEVFVANLDRYMHGQELLYVVDIDREY